MLIKAGVVVATASAALLAVSPLAFAGDYDDHGHGNHHGNHHGGRDHDGDDDDDDDNGGDNTRCDQDNSASHDRGRSGGLINLSDINVQVPVQACGNDILSGVLGILAKNQRNH